MRFINLVHIHCSATDPSRPVTVEDIRDWHVNGNGWSDIGYHFFIPRSGMVDYGRDRDADGDIWEEIGAHVRGHNRHSIGICLEGGLGGHEHDQFRDNFTVHQEVALVALLKAIKGALPHVRIAGHNEFAAKACPCFQVPPKVKEWGI